MSSVKRILVISVLCIASFAQAEQDSQYWNWTTLKLYNGERINLSLFSEFRFYDGPSEYSFHCFIGRLGYKAHKNLELGTSYTYFGYLRDAEEEWDSARRVDLELLPHWNLTDQLRLAMRHRLQLVNWARRGSFNPSTRHRIGFKYKTPRVKQLNAIYTNSEFFFDWDDRAGQMLENRTVPVGLNFKISDRASMSLFYLLRSTRAKEDADWITRHAAGTHLILSF